MGNPANDAYLNRAGRRTSMAKGINATRPMVSRGLGADRVSASHRHRRGISSAGYSRGI